MLILNARNQLIIGSLLLLWLVITRGHHFATAIHLPDASWALFFLAGFYLRHSAWFAVLLLGAATTDFLAINVGGVSSFCVSPAYVFLLPAYAALWFAGRGFAQRYQFQWRTLLPFMRSLLLGASLAEVFSSGGFYFFSGRFADTSLPEFGNRLLTYFPHSLQNFLFYVGVATAIHLLFSCARAQRLQRSFSPEK